MTKLSQPPAPVVVAAVLSGLFATFLLVVGVYAVSQGGAPIVLVIAAVLVAITWTLWTGRQSGRISAILVGAFLIVVGILISDSLTMRVLNIGFGIALVALVSVPASVRSYYSGQRRTVAG
jgi:hypothetical protein